MTHDEKEKMGFREWTSHYEKEQEADRDKLNSVVETVSTLSGNMNRLTANVETMMDNQKGMFNRMNRPWQWGVVVAIFMGLFSMAATFGTITTLVVSPIKANLNHLENNHSLDVQRNLELHMWFRETMANMQVSDAKNKTDIKWLSEMEARLNDRIHEGVAK